MASSAKVSVNTPSWIGETRSRIAPESMPNSRLVSSFSRIAIAAVSGIERMIGTGRSIRNMLCATPIRTVTTTSRPIRKIVVKVPLKALLRQGE